MEDAELLHALLKTPQKGCELLLHDYTGLVLAIVRRKLSDRSPQEHEELVSDILFTFYQKREQIDLSRGSIRSLLVTMTARMCIDYYRKQKSIPDTLDIDADTPIADTAPTPEEHALLSERKIRLMQAIRALGEPDSSIIIWKFYFGETAQAIAKRLSMRTKTVEMRISRAKEKLRGLLGGDEDDEA